VCVGVARFVLVVREPPGGDPALRLVLPGLVPGGPLEQQRAAAGERQRSSVGGNMGSGGEVRGGGQNGRLTV
jgi:hypothetical protein